MPKLFKLIPPAIFLMTLLFSADAYSASNSAIRSGEGSLPISGWTISHIHYLYANRPDLLAAVEFDLDQPAASVQIRLSGEESVFYSCAQTGDNHWVCGTGPGLPVSEMKTLVITAAGVDD
jgi:hypothetical protein